MLFLLWKMCLPGKKGTVVEYLKHLRVVGLSPARIIGCKILSGGGWVRQRCRVSYITEASN